MTTHLGLYINARRGFDGYSGLNDDAVRSVEELLELLKSPDAPDVSARIRMGRDRLDTIREVDDGFDRREEAHWLGVREFVPGDVPTAQLSGAPGRAVNGAAGRMLTTAGLRSFVTTLRSEAAAGNALALVLWGHADAPRAFLFSQVDAPPADQRQDSPAARDVLSPRQMHDALNGGLQGHRLAILGMDACQCGSIEFASVLSPFADVLIASQTPVPGSSWHYGEWPRALTGLTTATLTNRAEAIVDSFGKRYPERCSIAALDLRHLDHALHALGDLVRALLEKGGAALRIADTARQAIATHDREQSGMVDLPALLGEWRKMLPPALSSLCQAAEAGVRQVIIHAYASPGLALNGISIYYPVAPIRLPPPWPEVTDRVYFRTRTHLQAFHAATQWRAFLLAPRA